MPRALLIGVIFITMTPLLISLQWLLDKLHLPGWGFIATHYYRFLCRLLGIRVRVHPAKHAPRYEIEASLPLPFVGRSRT